MSSIIRNKHALLLEDFDIIKLNKMHPHQKVGVNINRIYIQIAKFSQNPNRSQEIQILKKAIVKADGIKLRESRYVVMELPDVMFCFGDNLKKLPKSTFMLTHSIENKS